MYVKMEELGPVGGGRAPARPPRSAYVIPISKNDGTALIHERRILVPYDGAYRGTVPMET